MIPPSAVSTQPLDKRIANVQSQIQSVQARLLTANDKLDKVKASAEGVPLAVEQCTVEAKNVALELDGLTNELAQLVADYKAEYNLTTLPFDLIDLSGIQ